MSNPPQETTRAMNTVPGSVTLNGVTIDDTFAEAFPMKATRVLITAHNETWARNAAVSMTGFATSVIACGCEAGIERMLGADETPDGRPGVSVLLFSMSGKELAKQLERRVGQCVLTCPTTAIYAGLDEGEAIALGRNLRFFGDGWQISKMIDGKRYWRVPVMDGFATRRLVEEVRRIVEDEGYRQEMVEHNYRVASRYYDYAELRRRLRTVLANIAGGAVVGGT